MDDAEREAVEEALRAESGEGRAMITISEELFYRLASNQRAAKTATRVERPRGDQEHVAAALFRIEHRMSSMERTMALYLQSTAYHDALQGVVMQGEATLSARDRERIGRALSAQVRQILDDESPIGSNSATRELLVEALTRAAERELANVAKEVAVESLGRDGDAGT